MTRAAMCARRIAVTLATFGVAAADAAPAMADERSEASLELGYFERHASESYGIYDDVLTLDPRFQVPVADHLSVGAAMALVRDQGRTYPANLVLGVRHREERGPYVWRVGLDITLPASRVTDDAYDADVALIGAAFGHGTWDLWRWVHDTTAAAVPTEVAWDWDGSRVRVEATAAYAFVEGEHLAIVQAGTAIEQPLGSWLVLGARAGVIAYRLGDELVIDELLGVLAAAELGDDLRVELSATQSFVESTPYSLPAVAVGLRLRQ